MLESKNGAKTRHKETKSTIIFPPRLKLKSRPTAGPGLQERSPSHARVRDLSCDPDSCRSAGLRNRDFTENIKLTKQ